MDYNMKKTIHIFDLDDTLTVTPTFAELMSLEDKDVIRAMGSIKKTLYAMFAKEFDFKVIGDFIVMLDANGRPVKEHYLDIIFQKVDEIESTIKPDKVKTEIGVSRGSVRELKRLLGKKDGHIIIANISGFHSKENTIGLVANQEALKIYNGAQNKAILTGRDIKLKPLIESKFEEIGISYPNYGFFCYDKAQYKEGIPNYKAQVISDLIEEYGWEEVHFYEDKEQWLRHVKNKIVEECPDIIFHDHLITNISDSKSI